jgi:hypothetical protein
MRFLDSLWIRLALAAGIFLGGAVVGAQADPIQGVTKGKSVSIDPVNKHPRTRDDRDVTSTIDIKFLAGSELITEAAKPFKDYNFVFAGDKSTAGKNFTPIDPSDFNVSAYTPWVGTSPDLTSPGGAVYNRDVEDQDAGGANILFTYTPSGGAPLFVNFLQAYSLTINKAAPLVAMDNGSAGEVPYYNVTGASGTDHNDVTTVPLDADLGDWMLDTPYVCESGPALGGEGCLATTKKNDETITSYVDTFDVFLEGDETFGGKDYNVLFGGFEWGFTFTATDAPELSIWAMLALGFAGLAVFGYVRRARGRVAARRRDGWNMELREGRPGKRNP